MKRNHELKIKMTSKEKKRLQKKAEELGLKISTYIRMISIKANFDIKK